MNPQDIRPDDRETLSALFDGELDADARLFALRRLGHDTQWQRTCGQWQLIGDAMRRNAPIAAPGDFAARVSAAVAAEASVPVAAARAAHVEPTTRRRRLRWIGGGALAASIALAFTVTTLPPGQKPAVDAGATVAAAPTTTREAPAITPAPVAVAVAESAEPVAAASPAPVKRDALRTASETPRLAAVASPPRRPAAVAATRSGDIRDAREAALLVGRTGNPFNLDADDALTARPWPRATLTGRAFTARYGASGDSQDERPSFYPFEPRLPGEAEPAPTP